jgi:hypothetical protein
MSKVVDNVIGGVLVVVALGLIFSMQLDLVNRGAYSAPTPSATPTISQVEQVLLDAMHHTTDAEAIIAGCSSAALRDDRLAAGQLRTNGQLCVHLTGTLQLKTYLGLNGTCQTKDYQCMFASGVAFVLVYTRNVPQNAEEMKALEGQIDFDYKSWLENRKRKDQ